MYKTLMVAAAAALLAAPVQAQQQFVNVLTGGTAGIYYPLGVALTKIVADTVPNSKPSAQATKASAENLNLLQAGRGEIALTLGDALADAWAGNKEAGFPNKLNRLRGVAAIYPNYIQIVARADSGIKRLADLKGKRISVGAPKSGTELNARAIFGANALKYSDFAKTEYLSFAESIQLMQNRQLDATLISAGLGVAAIRDLSSNTQIAIVSITPEEVAKIGNPVFQAASVPANTYTGQTTAAPTVKIQNYLVTHERVPADLVYNITKAMFDNLKTMVAAHSAARDIKLEDAPKGMPLPLHPGAERFYREKGLLK